MICCTRCGKIKNYPTILSSNIECRPKYKIISRTIQTRKYFQNIKQLRNHIGNLTGIY